MCIADIYVAVAAVNTGVAGVACDVFFDIGVESMLSVLALFNRLRINATIHTLGVSAAGNISGVFLDSVGFGEGGGLDELLVISTGDATSKAMEGVHPIRAIGGSTSQGAGTSTSDGARDSTGISISRELCGSIASLRALWDIGGWPMSGRHVNGGLSEFIGGRQDCCCWAFVIA